VIRKRRRKVTATRKKIPQERDYLEIDKYKNLVSDSKNMYSFVLGVSESKGASFDKTVMVGL